MNQKSTSLTLARGFHFPWRIPVWALLIICDAKNGFLNMIRSGQCDSCLCETGESCVQKVNETENINLLKSKHVIDEKIL